MKKFLLLAIATSLIGCTSVQEDVPPHKMTDKQICYKSTHSKDSKERILVKKELLVRGLILKPNCQFYRAGGKFF